MRNAEPHERRVAVSAFVVLLLILAGHAILETARDALFLASLPVHQLPWLYLIIAALALLVTRLEGAMGERLRRRDWLPRTLLGAGVVTSLLYYVAEFTTAGSLWLLYVWTGLFGTVAILQLWLTVSTAFDVEQAKRLYAWVGAGALLGATIGAGGARLLTEMASTRHLVLAAAASMIGAAAVARFALRPSVLAARAADRGRSALPPIAGARDLRGVVRDGYTRRVVLFALTLSAAVTIADYVFKREVVHTVASAELGEFFATFYGVVNVCALALQLVLVRPLLARIGAHWSLMVLPVALAAGGTWMGASGLLAAALLVKGADGALKHSLNQTALEVLFVPLGPRRRDVKTVVDVFGHRGGQALGSLLVLGIVGAIGWEALPWVLAGLGLLATALVWSTRRERAARNRDELGSAPANVTMPTRDGSAPADVTRPARPETAS